MTSIMVAIIIDMMTAINNNHNNKSYPDNIGRALAVKLPHYNFISACRF